MHTTDTIALLQVVAAYDKRTVGEADIEAWDEALEDLDFADCRHAVTEHYKNSDRWMQPSHVRAIVRATQNDRSMRRGLPPPLEPVGPKPDWFDELRDQHRVIQMDGCTQDEAPHRQGLWLTADGRPKTYENPRPKETA